MWRVGYRLLLWLAFPFVLARLWWRGRREPRYRENPGERFGFYRTAPARPVIWLHAVSLGETRAAEPLLRALQQQHPDCDLLITQMTANRPGGGRAAARWQRAGSLARLRLPIRRQTVLRHFRPRLGILMETEIWFQPRSRVRALQVPLVLAMTSTVGASGPEPASGLASGCAAPGAARSGRQATPNGASGSPRATPTFGSLASTNGTWKRSHSATR